MRFLQLGTPHLLHSRNFPPQDGSLDCVQTEHAGILLQLPTVGNRVHPEAPIGPELWEIGPSEVDPVS